MKNIEKYLDELLEHRDSFHCTTCRLRLGYDPCGEISTTEFCECYKELNKKWLKAEYVPNDVLIILKNLNPQAKYIYRGENNIRLSNREDHPDDVICVGDWIRYVNELFQPNLFDFLPLNQDVLIEDLLKGYKEEE